MYCNIVGFHNQFGIVYVSLNRQWFMWAILNSWINNVTLYLFPETSFEAV